jgi:hypothetical protein
MSDATPLFTVLKGNPSDAEVAALTAVFTQLAAAATPADAHERNLWGRPDDRLQTQTVFNPRAFHSVTFY